MACGCKERHAAMKASPSKAVRAVAKAIEPAHNVAMKVLDRAEQFRNSRKGKPRIIGAPIPPSEN